MVSSGFCFDRPALGCPASTSKAEIEDCFADKTSTSPFCIGEERDTSGTLVKHLLAPGKACSKAPYRWATPRFPAVSSVGAYDRVFHTREMWCAGSSPDGLESFFLRAPCEGKYCKEYDCSLLASRTFPSDSIWALFLPYEPNKAKGWIKMCVYTKKGPAAVVRGELPEAGNPFQLASCGDDGSSATLKGWHKVEVVLEDNRCGNGMTFDYGDESCADVNECKNEANPCGKNAVCTNLRGSFKCACAAGYVSNGKECVDENECEAGTDNCDQVHGICENTPVGDFTCSCREGWELAAASSNSTACVNVNECAPELVASNCGLNTNCTDAPGTYTCDCLDGYKRDDTTSLPACVDVDECAEADELGQPLCTDSANKYCSNVVGGVPGFECLCNDGYTHADGDGSICVDVNECAANGGLGPCSGNGANCTNTDGSYACGCGAGFALRSAVQLDQKPEEVDICFDVDECDANTSPCGANTDCNNKDGSFACDCRSGFVPAAQSTTVCTDIDECKTAGSNEESGICTGSNEVCENTPGEHECLCAEGFERVDGGCVDVEECSAAVSPCDEKATCTELDGSYQCDCNAGYNGDGILYCFDIDECVASVNGTILNPCNPDYAKCTNTDGGFECSCIGGYVRNKTVAWEEDAAENAAACDDVDECADGGAAQCSDQQTCVNFDGGFECQCSGGYEAVGPECVNVDECRRGTSSCGANSKCFDTVGSFICTCWDGWFDLGEAEGGEAGTRCEEPDWCGSDHACDGHPCCDEDAECSSDAGSGTFACTCSAGFTGSGLFSVDGGVGVAGGCVDVDECTEHKHNCQGDKVLRCKNVPGSFDCDCCATSRCDDDAVVSVDFYWNKDFQVCERNLCTLDGDDAKCHERADCAMTGTAAYECSCQLGYTGDGAESCADVNECADGGTADCHDAADCSNTEGSYTCACHEGWSGNGRVCTQDAMTPVPPTRTAPSNISSNNATSSEEDGKHGGGSGGSGDGADDDDEEEEEGGGGGGVYGFASQGSNSTTARLSELGGFPVKYIIIIVIAGQVFLVCIMTICARCHQQKVKDRKANGMNSDGMYDVEATQMGVYTSSQRQATQLPPYRGGGGGGRQQSNWNQDAIGESGV